MRAFLMVVFLVGSLGSVFAADAVTGRVIKLLPLLLDKQGQDSTSPSLFDRDAYQAHLRENPTNVFGVRFDGQPFMQLLQKGVVLLSAGKGDENDGAAGFAQHGRFECCGVGGNRAAAV